MSLPNKLVLARYLFDGCDYLFPSALRIQVVTCTRSLAGWSTRTCRAREQASMHIGIGDPVLVERSERSVADSPASSASAENTLLEGVVAHLGPQDFAPGNDWVGVRLTGASCGRGRNDGSVKGKRYFVCPEKCGVFVHNSAIRRRSLSRIEELRLRREIGSALLATEQKQKQMTTSPSTSSRDKPSSLQRALYTSPSSRKGRHSGERSQGYERSRSPSHAKTPPPPRTPRTSHRSSAGGNDGSTDTSARKSRLDQIRERKAALAAAAAGATANDHVLSSPRNTVPSSIPSGDTTASISPHTCTTTTSITAGETQSLGMGGASSAEEERNRSAEQKLSALRGEMIALRNENESLRNALHSREAQATGMAASASAARPSVHQMTLASDELTKEKDNASECLDSLDEVLDENSTSHIPSSQQEGFGLDGSKSTEADSAPFVDLLPVLADEIKTPAKPDLERRLAKALLKIALLSEELEDLRDSKQSGDEHPRDEEVLIRLSLLEIRKCPDTRCLPPSLPLALQGVVPTSDWPTFAREVDERMLHWAKTHRGVPWSSIAGACAASISLAFLYLSLYFVAALSILIAFLSLATSCYNGWKSRALRRDVDDLLTHYKERWPGTTIQLSEEKGGRRGCGSCSSSTYTLRIASDFDLERAQANFINTCTRGRNDTPCSGGSDLPARADLEESLLRYPQLDVARSS